MKSQLMIVEKGIVTQDYYEFNVLGLPYGGPVNDRDIYGERFTPETEFVIKPGSTIPAVYFHGRNERGSRLDKPVFYGDAILTHFDDRGGWFKVRVEKGKKYAYQLFEASQKGRLRASTGNAGTLRRKDRNGNITLWVPGELSLIDQVGPRMAVNDYAIGMTALKAIYRENKFNWPEAFEKARLDEEKLQKEKNIMDDDETDTDINIEEVTKQVIANLVDTKTKEEEEQAAEKAKLEAQNKETEKMMENAIVAALRTLNPNGTPPAFNQIKPEKGEWSGDEPIDAFMNWFRTGQESDDLTEYAGNGGEKAAWKEGTDSLGGYTVLDEVAKKIMEKRDEVSLARMMGAEVMKVSGKLIDVPLENTKLTDWAITAEEGSWDQDEGDLGVAAISIYKFTKLQKTSMELLADTEVDLLKFYMSRWGRSMGLTENQYHLNGTGSGQPQGALVGGTKVQDLASASTITSAEVQANFYGLRQEYRRDAVWTYRGSTNAIIRGLQGDEFLYDQTPQGLQVNETLKNKKSYESIKMPAFAVNAKVLLFGSWPHYIIAERSGMVMTRNDKLYEETGQIGHFLHFRQGSAVGQAEAFQYSQAAAA